MLPPVRREKLALLTLSTCLSFFTLRASIEEEARHDLSTAFVHRFQALLFLDALGQTENWVALGADPVLGRDTVTANEQLSLLFGP